MAKHLSRQELIKAVRRRPFVLDGHLKSCAECRDSVILLKAFDVSGCLPLPDAPSPWVERAASLAKKNVGVLEGVKTIMAKLTFDSWAVPRPIGVRGQSSLSDRRIRFESESMVFDLRAERKTTGWAFVAQVTTEGPAVAPTILEIGKRKLHADPGGLFQWTSSRPLTSVTVRSGNTIIVIPELAWKRPRPI